MHLRRVLLLMAMVLLLTAVVVAVAPPRRRQADVAAGPPPSPPSGSTAPRGVDLRFPPPKRLPIVSLMPGDHALVRLSAAQTGEASVMGLVDTAEPGTPATFDLLAPAPARYAVTFTPQFGRPRRVGTIEVRP